jgi:hypothetical protein
VRHRWRLSGLCLVTIGLVIRLSACGSGGGGAGGGSQGNPPPELTGNWQLKTTSSVNSSNCATSVQPCTIVYGGFFTVTGTSISGNFAHEPPDITEGVVGTVSGTISGTAVTLTLADPSGFTMQATATVQSASPLSFTGDSTSSGPSPLPAASGTIVGTAIPSLAGAWTGTIGSANVSATFTEQGFDAYGFPNLSGTMTFSGSPCFSTGTLTADQRGQYVNGPGLDGAFAQLAGLIQTNNGDILLAYNANGTAITTSNPSGTSITMAYLVWNGSCGGTTGNGTLSK